MVPDAAVPDAATLLIGEKSVYHAHFQESIVVRVATIRYVTIKPQRTPSGVSTVLRVAPVSVPDLKSYTVSRNERGFRTIKMVKLKL